MSEEKVKTIKTKLQGLIKNIGAFYKKNAKVIMVAVLAVALVAGILIVGETYKKKTPYTITLDGEVLCCVSGKDGADDVMDNLVSEYIEDNTTVRAIDTDGRLNISLAKKEDNVPDNMVSVEEAVSMIEDQTDSRIDNPLSIKIISSGEEIAEYTPTPNYTKAEKELAGYTKVESEGKNGVKQYFVMYTTVNGKLESKDATDGKIIEEGVPADVTKGVLGLPEGEDWETYTGDPTYRNGEDISVTGQQYIGKVRYRLGGTSLTSGVDCVGFVRAIYRLYGIYLPSRLGRVGTHVSYSNAQPGDIVIYSSHVGIYIGDGKIVHATSGKGVSISDAKGIGKAITDVRRVK